VKCTRNEEFSEDQDGQGEWRTKAVWVIPEMECLPGGEFSGVVHIHPGKKRERPAIF
jgi:hypothetical protein